MNRNVLSTVDDEIDAIRGLFPADYGLAWLNSEEGLIAVDPFFVTLVRKMDRQVRYRLRRDASLSRDQPPRLPCRPWFNNGDEHEWEDQRKYHQTRVSQEEIEPKHDAQNVDVCYTCTNHRFCTGPVCEAGSSLVGTVSRRRDL